VIARLRTQRRWSRAQLVIRLYSELSPDDPRYESISETWLARLENGRMVKVPRQTVEALCRALRCTPRERAHVLLHADRCALTDHESAPTAPAEVLAYVMDRLYSETHDLLTGLLGPRAPESVDEMELLEMASEAHAPGGAGRGGQRPRPRLRSWPRAAAAAAPRARRAHQPGPQATGAERCGAVGMRGGRTRYAPTKRTQQSKKAGARRCALTKRTQQSAGAGVRGTPVRDRPVTMHI
jgi:transcriptional regulator with XRE-family HTH domain